MKSYAEQNLMPNERIIYTTGLHWMTLIFPGIFALLVLFILILDAANTTSPTAASIHRNPSSLAITILLLVIAGLLFLSRYISYKSSEFAVTNQRLMVKVGWIRRNTLELLLKKIEGVSVDQSILGRIFDFGNITVSGTGGAKSPFQRIAKPMNFRNELYKIIAENEPKEGEP